MLNIVRPALTYLERSDAARVVNIGAVSAREPDPEMLAIGTARAAVANLSRGLAAELAPQGILVNAVAVGVIATGRTAARHQRVAPERPFAAWATDEAARRGIPLGRLGTADEVAAAVTFLLSPVAGYITGATLEVAGGLGRGW